MRKFILSLLLASVAATPALAARPDRDDREAARSERQQSREDRSDAQSERQSSREDRGEAREIARPDVQVDRQQVRVDREQNAVRQQVREHNVVRRDVDAARVARIQAAQSAQQQRVADRQQLRTDRRDARVLRNRVPVVSNVPREGTQPPAPTEVRHSGYSNWNTDWRHNSRYDWYRYRNNHRWLFNLGLYNDPFGWGYQPYSIGWRMWPSYYGSNFWLNDPYEYRLPYAPPGYRWIRYYDDAILVDTWDGRVVDVIYDFFW